MASNEKILIKRFRYDGSRKVDVAPQETPDGAYFEIQTDSQGREVRRLDYDSDSRLKAVIESDYDSRGDLNEQGVYEVSLSFSRHRNAGGLLEERSPEGELIRVLEED